MTQSPSLIRLFVAPMNRAQVRYMVTGGLAAVVYGHPRLTLDIDLVLRLSSVDAVAFAGLWPRGEFYSPPPEVIEAERNRAEHGHFNIIHNESMMRADLYFAGADEFAGWALENRVVRHVENEPVFFAPIEYVIVSKLRYFQMGGSERHLRDIARMMQVSGPDVDRSLLRHWVTVLNVEEEWAQALAFSEPA